MTKRVISNPEIVKVTEQIWSIEHKLADDMNVVMQRSKSAMQRRWEMGKLLHLNEDLILSEFEKWGDYAETIGTNLQVISNNKNGYRNLLNAGCDTWDKVLKLLEERSLPVTTYTFERLGKLLAAPKDDEPQKVQRPKDEKRLEELAEEVEAIVKRNETSNHNTFELAKGLFNQILDAGEHIGKVDPYKSTWRSEKYLDFVRQMGMDFITMSPEDAVDPHHTLPDETQRMGLKVADVFTIPVARDIHQMIENGSFDLTKEEISDALIRTMSLFIIHNFK